MPETWQITLEQMIDQQGLTRVVDSIIQTCYDKAQRVRENYQDEYLANRWDKAGASLANPKDESTHPDGFPT